MVIIKKLIVNISAEVMRHAKPQYTRSNQMRTIQQNGELYLSSFDFFQNIQRWMYQQGLFNYFGPMQD